MHFRLSFLALLFCPIIGWSQNDTTVQSKNSFTVGANYQSKLHFFGRTDSLQSSGLFPTIGFELKEGFYSTANIIFTRNNSSSLNYNGSTVEAGYKFPKSRNFSGNVFYSKFLYKDNSQLVQSSVKGQAGLNLTYNNKIVNVNGGADAKFSDKTDLGLTAGVDHLFLYVFPGTKNALGINPSFYTYAGTQNFTKTYYKNREVLGVVLGQQQVTEQAKTFKLLAYEASLPVVLILGKFYGSVTGSYVLPQNLIKVTNRPDLTENGKNLFYISAGLGVKL